MPRAGGASVPPPPAAGARGTDLKTGYLEKRIGEHSTRSSLPDAFRWQRRYFVLTESKGMLYYFKSPDDPPNYKGVLSLRDCKIDDLDADGSVRGGSSGAGNATRSSVSAASGGKYDLDGGGASGGGNASASSSLSASTGSLPGGGSGGGVSLLFRISHRDPTRAVYKNHASLVLRAESASEKYSWLARLRAAAANAASGPPESSTSNPAASPRSAGAGPLASGAAKRAGGGANGSGDGAGGGSRGGRRGRRRGRAGSGTLLLAHLRLLFRSLLLLLLFLPRRGTLVVVFLHLAVAAASLRVVAAQRDPSLSVLAPAALLPPPAAGPLPGRRRERRRLDRPPLTQEG